ncbi:sigma-70 family RNA polymerase sigma factor [Telmatocola sphagniphila]|jgi:RNA polymerase sigma-70 factor (ECF subfamily)|uniref:Sigma-70 family RNA polymerase sigma factor n=1 Tax=Telmatocola sphagniphila TaxID=1123043 RepID=A0A8E6B5C0_9BACT|nr:sigma-70 family RNA polymerase sigma factor [Telmatocola sphagniphila]QVL32218.1 sigma-70 family RNA polymerase sigma factor [Telmatocola sphagniphila]
MSSEADKLLIKQIRKGETQAWEQLIQKYEGRLLAFAIRRLRDRATAEDVVQETFIGFLNSLANFDDNRELQTYLFTIASYKITDQLRRMGRKPVQTGETAEERLAEQTDETQRKASSLARSRERVEIETNALARSLKQMIQGLIDKGEYGRMQALELLFVKGWQNRDVAKFLQISEQQVANYRFAAVKKLTEQMKAAGLPAEVFPELKEEGTE